jgi:uncharacterized Zn-finger protein
MLECDECPLAFALKNTLINHHRAIHTTDRPFACSVCATTFSVASSRTKHEKAHLKPTKIVTKK